MGLKEDIIGMKKEVDNVQKNIENDSNSVYLVKRTNTTLKIILFFVLGIFTGIFIFIGIFMFNKIDSIDNKIDTMINSEEEYLPYENTYEQ